MATHRHQGRDGGLYFCTATCWDWLSLIEQTQLFDHLFGWMSLIHGQGCRMVGYVLMPNHVHVMLFVPEQLSVNIILANMKRLAAYEVVKRLQRMERSDILAQLADAGTHSSIARSQKHRVWRTSSDIKPCVSRWFTEQKLNYIHGNPVRGKWALVEDAVLYPHSSAAFHMEGKENKYVRLMYAEEAFEEGASGSSH